MAYRNITREREKKKAIQCRHKPADMVSVGKFWAENSRFNHAHQKTIHTRADLQAPKTVALGEKPVKNENRETEIAVVTKIDLL